jgi:hypothetical protein
MCAVAISLTGGQLRDIWAVRYDFMIPEVKLSMWTWPERSHYLIKEIQVE